MIFPDWVMTMTMMRIIATATMGMMVRINFPETVVLFLFFAAGFAVFFSFPAIFMPLLFSSSKVSLHFSSAVILHSRFTDFHIKFTVLRPVLTRFLNRMHAARAVS